MKKARLSGRGGENNMTENELLELPTVGPNEASKFLGGDPTAEFIRVWCQEGRCPFGTCVQMSPRRKNYTINRQRLILYRRGEVPPSLPEAVVRIIEKIAF